MATNPSALSFNGTTQYVSLNPNVTIKGLSTFSVYAWLKVGSLSDDTLQMAYTERQGTGKQVRFGINAFNRLKITHPNYLRFLFAPRDGDSPTHYAYQYTWDNRWHHVGFTANLSSTPPVYQILIDGTAVAAGNLVLPAGVTAVSNTVPVDIFMGGASYELSTDPRIMQPTAFWNGKIDDLIIFNTAKTESDARSYIASNDFYNSADASVVGNWRLTEGTGEGTGATSTVEIKSSHTGALYILPVNTASQTLWTKDRAMLGGGVVDTTAPANFALAGTPVTNITTTGFTINYNATTDDVFVQYYEIQVATINTFTSYVSINAGQVTTYAITGLIPGTNYYVRVRAFDAANNASGYTPTASTTTTAAGDIIAPSSPVQSSVTSLSFAGFTANWSAATDNTAVTGYKIDVGTDVYFNNFLSAFRNRDVGNVLLYAVTGTTANTDYYIRIRAYDAVGNESVSSNVVYIKTPPPPDTTAPNVVTVTPATSVTYNSFTANWLATFDNIGVATYYLDVNTDPTFAIANVVGYDNLNVGNVLAWPVIGLNSEVGYSYRVRAADAAGNISTNTDAPYTVQTLAPSITVGGFYTSYLVALQDTYVDSSLATTNFGAGLTLVVAGNGTTATKIAFVQFDLTGVIGTIQRAYFMLYTTVAAASNITITGPAGAVTFNELTATYNVQPSGITGGTVAGIPLTASAYFQLDVTSLMTLGNALYTFKVSTTNNISATFSSKESVTNPPQMQVQSDPSTGLQIMTLAATPVAGQRTNYWTNPSAETNTTGMLPNATGSTLTRVTSDSYIGSASFQVVGTGAAANQGIITGGTIVPAVLGDTWTITFFAKVASGTLGVNISLQELNSSGTQLVVTNVTSTLTSSWQRFSVTRTLNNASTAFVGLWVYANSLVAFTMFVDGVMFSKAAWSGAYFDGNTSGAAWTGTANNSSSTMGAAQFTLLSTYLGDSDNDSTAYYQFKRSDAPFTDWIHLPVIDTQTTLNHATKQLTSTVGKSYGVANGVYNPSFELNTNHWITSGTGITISQITSDFEVGSACLQAVYTSAAGNRNVQSAITDTTARQNDAWTFSVYLKASAACTATLLISERGSVGTSLNDQVSPTINITTSWQRFSFTTTLTNPITFFVSGGWIYATAVGVTIFADGAMLDPTPYLNPYIDGDQVDGQWESVAHASTTGRTLSPLTSYDFQAVYTDPDGIVGSTTGATVGTYGGTATSLNIPTNTILTGTLTLSPTNNEIDAVVTYTGDDNANSTILFEWKRTDLSAWSSENTVYDRVNKRASAAITSLNPGVSYTVRATFTDSDNASGTYGTNPLVAMTNTTTAGLTPDGSSLITFGGFVLMGRDDDLIGVSEHDAFGMPSRRITIEDLSRLDGSVETMNFWGRRPISMKGFVSGASRGDLDSNLTMLKRALAPAKQPLVINTLVNNGRYYTATLESFATGEVAGTNYVHLTWDANFICADPFAYDLVAQTTTFSASNGNTISIINDGDVSVDQIITVTTSNIIDTILTITNVTTGERITPTPAFLFGDVLTFDGARVSLKKNDIEVDYAGSFPRLSVGSNTLSFTITPTTASITVTITWRQKYL